jgi:hypothetical protein
MTTLRWKGSTASITVNGITLTLVAASDTAEAKLAALKDAERVVVWPSGSIRRAIGQAAGSAQRTVREAADVGPRPEWLQGGRVEVMDRERGPCPLCGEPVEDHDRRIGGYRNEGARGSTIYVLDRPCRIRASVAKRRRLAELEAKAGAR